MLPSSVLCVDPPFPNMGRHGFKTHHGEGAVPLPFTPATLPAMRRAMPAAPVRGCGTRALMRPCSVLRVSLLLRGRHGSTIGNATGTYHRLGTRALMHPCSVLCVNPQKGGSGKVSRASRGRGRCPSPVADYHVGNASGNANGTRSRLWNEGVDASVLRPPCRPLTKRTARFHDQVSEDRGHACVDMPSYHVLTTWLSGTLSG